MPRWRFAATVALVTITACGGVSSPVDGRWVLVEAELDGAPILTIRDTPSMVGAGRQVTLEVHGPEASGQAPCNAYGGPLDISEVGRRGVGGSGEVVFEWGEVFATLVGCLGVEIEEAERDYFAALLRTEQGVRRGNRLTLLGPGTRLMFQAAPDP